MNHHHPAPEDEEDFEGQPSKSHRKREMHALQDLGKQLVALPPARLAKLPLPDSLRDAVMECQRLTDRHEALRRQIQYIGKVMRRVDPEPIRAALEALAGTSREEVARQHRVERLRQELLDDEGVLHTIATRWPGADLQHLRVLRRNALKEQAQNKPPRAFRELFKMLRALELPPGSEADPDEPIPGE